MAFFYHGYWIEVTPGEEGFTALILDEEFEKEVFVSKDETDAASQAKHYLKRELRKKGVQL